MSEHEVSFEEKTNRLPWLALFLRINWSHLWIVCLLEFFFFFLPRTPDQALTSGCKAGGVGDKVVIAAEGLQRKKRRVSGGRHFGPPKALSWLLTRCPAGILPTASAVFQCQPLA